jgi:excisionase family DNA binding protein
MSTNRDSLPRLLTVEETGDLLRVGRSTVYRLIADGEIPSTWVGHQLRVPSAELLDRLAEA